MRYLFAILFVSLLCSCSDKECCADLEPDVIGDWKLSKLCASAGNSSCTEASMWDVDFDEVFSFRSDGSFTTDREGTICTGSYSFDGDREIFMTSDNNECHFIESNLIIGRLTTTEMLISPMCVEGCFYLYIKQ